MKPAAPVTRTRLGVSEAMSAESRMCPVEGDVVDGTSRQNDAAEAQLAQRDAELAEAWGRYHELRRRRVVRAALALAELPHVVRSAVRHLERVTFPRGSAAVPVVTEPAAEAAGVPADGQWPVEVPKGVLHCWPLGHYYSPVPDTRELSVEPARSRIWGPKPRETPGIDWRADAQLSLVRRRFRPPSADQVSHRAYGRPGRLPHRQRVLLRSGRLGAAGDVAPI